MKTSQYRANKQKAASYYVLQRLHRIDRSGPISADDPFILRIVKALDIDFPRLAEICEISYHDIEELLDAKRTKVSKFDTDPMWNKLDDYVRLRLALTMAVKQDLDAKMQDDRSRRVAQRLREKYHV